MKTFGVGIIGAGTIGKVHAAAIAELEEARVVAIAEPREEAGRALAAEHGADWYAGEAALLARPDVDIVTLATPSGLHAAQAIAAAQAGKHVVTEKPMATTVADAGRMIAAAREADVALAVIFQNRFTEGALRLKRAAEAGRLGQIVLGNALVHWHRSDEYYAASGGWRGTWALDGGGALMNQSIHTIDLLQWIVGPVASVAAEIATLNHAIETEDTASAALRFQSGALGAIEGTTAAGRDWPARLEIVGTAGRAVLSGTQLIEWEATGGEDDLLSDADRQLIAGLRREEPFSAGHARQFRAIFAALREGRQPPVPGSEARNAVEIIRAIYRSAQSGRRVSLPLAGDQATPGAATGPAER